MATARVRSIEESALQVDTLVGIHTRVTRPAKGAAKPSDRVPDVDVSSGSNPANP